jgi:hypothetical protein
LFFESIEKNLTDTLFFFFFCLFFPLTFRAFGCLHEAFSGKPYLGYDYMRNANEITLSPGSKEDEAAELVEHTAGGK